MIRQLSIFVRYYLRNHHLCLILIKNVANMPKVLKYLPKSIVSRHPLSVFVTTHPVTQKIIHRTIACPLSASVKKIMYQSNEFNNLTFIRPSPSRRPRSIVRQHFFHHCSLARTIIKCSPATTHQSTIEWRPHKWWMGHFNFRHTNQIAQGSVYYNITAQLQKECSFCKKYRERRCDSIFCTFIW